MRKPIVSVIISCYNHESYIEAAIDSVMNQTLQDFELLIADDGSIDNSREVIKKTIEKYGLDSRIVFYPNEKNTLFKCWDELQLKANGEFITTMGSDDVWAPNKLEHQVDFLRNHSEYKACFTWVEVLCDEENQKKYYENSFNIKNRSQSEWVRTFFFEGNRLCAPSMMMCSEVWYELRGYDFSFRNLQDFDLWLRFVSKYSFYVLPEKLTLYRRHENNLSSGTDIESLSNIAFEQQYLLYEFIDNMPDDLFIESFCPTLEKDIGSDDYKAEVICRKFLELVNCKMLLVKDNAINFWLKNRNVPGFLKKLEEKFNYSRKELYDLRTYNSTCRKNYELQVRCRTYADMLSSGKIHMENLNRSDESLVDEILNIIDDNGKSHDCDLNKINEDYIMALYRVCMKVPEGKMNFAKIVNALFKS